MDLSSIDYANNQVLIAGRKRILHIVEAMGGGVFTYLVNLSNYLCSEFEVYIAYSIRPQTPKNYRDYFDKRINLIEVKNFRRCISITKDINAFFEIRRIAKYIKPDIIHLHSSKAGVIGRWAFDGRKINIFYTPHGYSFLMKDHGSFCRSIYRLIEMLSSKRNCITISCSPGENSETLKLTKRATYVNNGIDISNLEDLINYSEKDINDHTFTVYTLGRICNQKNPYMFNLIAEKLPHIKFLWIGDGELREVLTSSNIEITGWVDRKTALKYASKADAFILTSLWEGLPISLLESMCIKKICIVSNVAGNIDVIQNGVNGFVCDNIDDFVSAINKVNLKDCNEDMIKSNAHDCIINTYNTIVMAKQYSCIYKF